MVKAVPGQEQNFPVSPGVAVMRANLPSELFAEFQSKMPVARSAGGPGRQPCHTAEMAQRCHVLVRAALSQEALRACGVDTLLGNVGNRNVQVVLGQKGGV